VLSRIITQERQKTSWEDTIERGCICTIIRVSAQVERETLDANGADQESAGSAERSRYLTPRRQERKGSASKDLILSVFRETRDDFPERRWGLTAKDAEVAKIT
jgi:hypothetical protein